MPFTPRLELPSGLHVPCRIDPTGIAGPTAGQARGPKWHRVGKNAYRPALGHPAPEQRILDAIGQMPECGAITGWAALRLHGAAYFDGRRWGSASDRPVLIAAGRRSGHREAPGVLFTYEPLAPDEVVVVHGVRTTVPVRALFDELRQLPERRHALVAAEMALAARVIRLAPMRDYAQRHRRWRRSLAAIAVLEEARPGARSPKEVEVRDICELEAGLPMLGINIPVFDLAGHFLMELDLLEQEAGLAIEYDGEDHAKTPTRVRDAERHDLCARHRIEHVTIVGPDLRSTPKVVERVRSARARARFLPPDQRSWTTEWPPGWVPWW